MVGGKEPRGKLSALFIPALAETERRGFELYADLETHLSDRIAAARQAWPQLAVPDETFLPYLASLMPENVEPEDAINAIRWEDLYLACACLHGSEAALRAFEIHCLSDLPRALAHLAPSGQLAEEIEQVLKKVLLVGEQKEAPKLAQYRGRGDLRSWVRVAAIRYALNWNKKFNKERQLDDRMLADLAAEQNQELEYFRALYRQEFKNAFHQSMADLNDQERHVLRSNLLDGLSIDEIGALYRVHRATAARWLTRIRKKIETGTRTVLMHKLKVSPSEFQSIMRLVMSQFDVSLRRALEDAEICPHKSDE